MSRICPPVVQGLNEARCARTGRRCGAETDRRSRRPFSDRNRLARLWRGADLARDFPREAAAQSAVLTFPREPGTQQAIDVALTHRKTRSQSCQKDFCEGSLEFLYT